MVSATSVTVPVNINLNLGGGGRGRGGGGGGGGLRTKSSFGFRGMGVGSRGLGGGVSAPIGESLDRIPPKLDKATRSARMFNMELLGTMFFGMQIQRLFGGWVTSVAQLTGIGDVLKALLISILMPVLIPIVKFTVKIVKKIMALPKPVKSLLGALIIMMAIFGTILFFGSQFLLFVGAIAAMVVGIIGLLVSGSAILAGGALTLGGVATTIMGIVSLLGFVLLIGTVVVSVFAGMTAWVLSLEDTLRRVVSLLLIASGVVLSGTGIGAIAGLPMLGAGMVGLTPDIKIIQNNIGGLLPTAEANRQASGLFMEARGFIAGLMGG